MSFENTVGKGEVARNDQFLLFPQCFYPFGELSAIFIKVEIIVCIFFFFFSLDGSKFCRLGQNGSNKTIMYKARSDLVSGIRSLNLASITTLFFLSFYCCLAGRQIPANYKSLSREVEAN